MYMFHHQMKHREESWKYDAKQSIFDELNGVIYILLVFKSFEEAEICCADQNINIQTLSRLGQV